MSTWDGPRYASDWHWHAFGRAKWIAVSDGAGIQMTLRCERTWRFFIPEEPRPHDVLVLFSSVVNRRRKKIVRYKLDARCIFLFSCAAAHHRICQCRRTPEDDRHYDWWIFPRAGKLAPMGSFLDRWAAITWNKVAMLSKSTIVLHCLHSRRLQSFTRWWIRLMELQYQLTVISGESVARRLKLMPEISVCQSNRKQIPIFILRLEKYSTYINRPK